jgi:creatinine amidohydrolase/Fe(II)-dependent formamide hydrolase-like protein
VKPKLRPRKSPCASCPFRRDCPSGVWSEEEYDKLPGYDGPTWAQSPSVFFCHLSPEEACAGWAATFDMSQNLGLRIIAAHYDVQWDAFLDYQTTVAVFESGAQAAEHGRAMLENPTEEAAAAIEKIEKQRAATGKPIRYA